MSGVDLDEYDDSVDVPRDAPNPCACMTNCKDRYCEVSSQCKEGVYRDRFLGLIPYGPTKKPCGVDDAEEAMRYAHRGMMDAQGRITYPQDDRMGGAGRKHKHGGGRPKQAGAKPKPKHNAGNYEYYARNVHGHTYRVAQPHAYAHYPSAYSHYHYPASHYYGYYGHHYPRYYHVSAKSHRHSRSKSKSKSKRRSHRHRSHRSPKK
jgi:hypothetical protein